MYEAFYGLREKPFSIVPDPAIMYWGQSHREGLATLEFCILNNIGFAVVTGEIGSGKTTLVRYLTTHLPRGVTIGVLDNTPRSRDELLQWIMLALGQPYEGTYTSLYSQFRNFVQSQHANGLRTLLIIDEAQNFSAETLEDLRLLSNLNVDKHQMLQFILVGQPQLRQSLSEPEMAQFAQRISADYHLKPLDLKEVTEYIDFRLETVGAQTTLFNDEACSLIAQESGGVPRTINIICEMSLVYGLGSGAEQITGDLVREVIEQRQAFSAVA